MKTHTIPLKPHILDWERIPAVKINSCHWTPPVDIEAAAQICYDAGGLYVRLSAREEHIRAEETGPLGSPCQDSCLEFFFSPMAGDDRYFNFEFSPKGCMFLGLGTGTGSQDVVRLLPTREDLFQAKPRMTRDGWEITFQIPTEFIRQFFPGYAPVSGSSIRANFYKCGDLTRQEHYFSWNPCTSEAPAFHCPWDFGSLLFA